MPVAYIAISKRYIKSKLTLSAKPECDTELQPINESLVSTQEKNKQ